MTRAIGAAGSDNLGSIRFKCVGEVVEFRPKHPFDADVDDAVHHQFEPGIVFHFGSPDKPRAEHAVKTLQGDLAIIGYQIQRIIRTIRHVNGDNVAPNRFQTGSNRTPETARWSAVHNADGGICRHFVFDHLSRRVSTVVVDDDHFIRNLMLAQALAQFGQAFRDVLFLVVRRHHD